MRGISESSPTRAMAEDLDVEAMLEAPYKKGVRLNFFSLFFFLCVFSVCSFEILTFFILWNLPNLDAQEQIRRRTILGMFCRVAIEKNINRPSLPIYTCRTKYALVSYRLLINTSVFCTYRWYVTCTLALVGCSAASS